MIWQSHYETGFRSELALVAVVFHSLEHEHLVGASFHWELFSHGFKFTAAVCRNAQPFLPLPHCLNPQYDVRELIRFFWKWFLFRFCDCLDVTFWSLAEGEGFEGAGSQHDPPGSIPVTSPGWIDCETKGQRSSNCNQTPAAGEANIRPSSSLSDTL